VTGTATRPAGGRWIRAIASGFLAELSTVLTIILIVESYRFVFRRGASDAEYAAFGAQTGAIVGVLGGAIYTYVFARLLMLTLPSRFIAHGVVVALTAIAFSVAGSLAGHHGVPASYVLASILKLVAGVLAGVVAAKRTTVPATV
jgi:hypothetical protein